MIDGIYVDGFRSLRDFSMSIHSGLNVMIGINGSGKTNILKFFEFVSHFVDDNLNSAISNLGGSRYLFSQEDNGKSVKRLNFLIYGKITKWYGSGARKRTFEYEYGATIAAIADQTILIVAKEQIKLRRAGIKAKLWDLDIVCEQSEENDFQPKVRVEKIDKRIFNPSRRKTGHLNWRTDELENELPELLIDGESFLKMLQRTIIETRQILNDLTGNTAIMVDPAKIRGSEDSTSPPGIQKDGSGLASTLFYLITIEKSMRRRGSLYVFRLARQRNRSGFRFRPSRRIFDSIKRHVNLVNPQIVDIEVNNNILRNEIEVYFVLDCEGSKLRIPLEAISDGTLKWTSLMTAIALPGTIFAVEEPENFLHPNMQNQIVDIMRSELERQGRGGFSILTTHSETLLNAVRPEEVVLIKNINGKTTASRIEDVEMLMKEISKTGFGLGYYYYAGALDD